MRPVPHPVFMERHRVPLEQLRVISPCHEDWEKMSGDDRKRFCSQCDRHVHNLSAMSRRQVETLAREATGRLCVNYVPDSEGNPLTLSDRSAGYRLRWGVARGFAMLAGVVTLMLAPTHDAQASVNKDMRSKLDPARLVETGRKIPAVSKTYERLLPANQVFLGRIAVKPTPTRGKVQIRPQPLTGDTAVDPAKSNSKPPK